MKTYDAHKSKSEVRQGNERHMNLRVLLWSIGGIAVAFVLLYSIYGLLA